MQPLDQKDVLHLARQGGNAETFLKYPEKNHVETFGNHLQA